jgi:hypothetical protein
LCAVVGPCVYLLVVTNDNSVASNRYTKYFYCLFAVIVASMEYFDIICSVPLQCALVDVLQLIVPVIFSRIASCL